MRTLIAIMMVALNGNLAGFRTQGIASASGKLVHENAHQLIELVGFFLVAGIGFEPMTFRL